MYGIVSPRLNTIVQLYIQPHMRGRIQSLFMFVFGLVPVGQIFVGWLAEWIGTQTAVFSLSLGFTVLSSSILLFAHPLRKTQLENGTLIVYH